MTTSSDNHRTAALILLACSLAIGSPTSHAGEAPATANAPSQPAKGTGGTKAESGYQREHATQQAMALREILRTAESLDPLDRDNVRAYLARAARRFPASEEVARSLFRALGPKPQILSAEFDPADGHIVRMVTQDTIVRTDGLLAPIPDWVLEFTDALAGKFTVDQIRTILKRVTGLSATDPWTRQAKWALAEQLHAASILSRPDQAASRLGWETYAKTCALCHGPDGRGIRNQTPPLAGSDWVLLSEPNRLIRITLSGLRGPIKVRGKVFDNSACPPLGEQMSDAEVAAVLTHIRMNRFWGHALPPVSAAEVKTLRETAQRRTAPWNAAELLNPSAVSPGANPQPPSTKPSEFE